MSLTVELTRDEINTSFKGKKSHSFDFVIKFAGTDLLKVRGCRVHLGEIQPPARQNGKVWVSTNVFSELLKEKVAIILSQSPIYLQAVNEKIIGPLGSSTGDEEKAE